MTEKEKLNTYIYMEKSLCAFVGKFHIVRHDKSHYLYGACHWCFKQSYFSTLSIDDVLKPSYLVKTMPTEHKRKIFDYFSETKISDRCKTNKQKKSINQLEIFPKQQDHE
jgi:hypothetical protein